MLDTNKLKEEIAADLKAQQETAEIRLKVAEATGVDFLVTRHNYKDRHDYSIHIGNMPQFNSIKFDVTKMQEYVTQIQNALQLQEKNAVLTFASSSDNKSSGLNIKLTVENYTNKGVWGHRTQGKVAFFFEGFSVFFTDDLENVLNAGMLVAVSYTEPSTTRNKYPMKKTWYRFGNEVQSANYSGGSSAAVAFGDSRYIYSLIKHWSA